jgi:hypothetical protein
LLKRYIILVEYIDNIAPVMIADWLIKVNQLSQEKHTQIRLERKYV